MFPPAPQVDGYFEGNASYKPPAQRLHDVLHECSTLDQELIALEMSGYTRIETYAKPFAMKRNLKSTKREKRRPRPSTTNSLISQVQDNDKKLYDDDEDSCSDLILDHIYSEQQTLSTQLLRARMRALALVKLVHGPHSVSKAHAEMELGEAYARMNLWKQAELHASCAANLLREIEIESQTERGNATNVQQSSDILQLVLEFFYRAQCDEASRGCIVADELLLHLSKDREAKARDHQLAAVFARDVLMHAFGSDQTLHWQRLLLRLEASSEELHQHLTVVSARLPPGVTRRLKAMFVALDPAKDGFVPFHTFLDRLRATSTDLRNRKCSAFSYFQALCITLQRVLDRVNYHSLAWTELITLGAASNLRLPANDEDSNESPSFLLARVSLLLSRVHLQRERFEEAVCFAQVAVIAREKAGADSIDLVQFYLVAAEAQARRGHQLRVLGQQTRRDQAEQWLQTSEGSRFLRSRALEEVELASGNGGPLLTKKDAEAWAKKKLMKELMTTPLSSALQAKCPTNDHEASACSLMENAVENCGKAWQLQELYCGRQHVSTASVHVRLAHVHLLQSGNENQTSSNDATTEAIRNFTAAIDVYENACGGIVLASAFLRLELAQVYHQDQLKQEQACVEYALVARFFAAFSSEFAESQSAKRECSALSLNAFRQWITLSRRSGSASLEEQRVMIAEMHAVSVTGYGEFAIEACQSGADLARLLHRIATSKQEPHSEIHSKLRTALRLLTSARCIAESLWGVSDCRSQRLGNETNEIETCIRSTLDGTQEDVSEEHDWLTQLS